MPNRPACDCLKVRRYMTGPGEAQVSSHHPICRPTLASQRGWDASDYAADIARDAPLGHPKGLANEGAETRRGSWPRGIRRSRFIPAALDIDLCPISCADGSDAVWI